MTKGLITVFGGSGFLGKYVIRELVKEGWRVRVPVRRPHTCLLYTSPSPRDGLLSRMPSSA